MERNILEIQWVSSLILKIQLSYLKKWKEIVKNYELLQKFNQNLLMITWKIVGPHIKPWIPNDHYPEFEEKYDVHWDRGHNNSMAHHVNSKLEYKLFFCGKAKINDL